MNLKIVNLMMIQAYDVVVVSVKKRNDHYLMRMMHLDLIIDVLVALMMKMVVILVVLYH